MEIFGVMIVGIMVLILLLGVVYSVLRSLWKGITWLTNIESERERPRCPKCGELLSAAEASCVNCSWRRDATTHGRDSSAALQQLIAEVIELRDDGLIDAVTCQRLCDAVFKEIYSLRARASSAAPSVESSRPQAPRGDTEAPTASPALNDLSDEPILEVVEPSNLGAGDSPTNELSPLAGSRQSSSPASIRERAERYAASRAEAQAPTTVSSIAPPAETPLEPPAQPFSAWFSAFLEERNIRWGELIGGLLIVGCSIALVLSFWSEIAERPYLKFFVLNGVTASFFGVGFYAQRRWHLENSTRGLLTIATLLVPLDFLAIAAFTQRETGASAATIGGELFSTVLFATLIYHAGRTIARPWPLALAAVALVPAVGQLLVHRVSAGEVDLRVWGLAFATTLPLLVAAILIDRALRGESLTEATDASAATPSADSETSAATPAAPAVESLNRFAIYRLLGIAGFSLCLTLGLIVARHPPALSAMHRLSTLATVIGVAPLLIGLTLWRRAPLVDIGYQRLVGASLAVAGALLCAASMLLAWPEVNLSLAAAALNFCLFTILGLACGIAEAQTVAAVCLAWACLLGSHFAAERIDWRGGVGDDHWRLLVSGESALPLTGIAAILGAVGGMWRHQRRAREAIGYWIVAATCAAGGLALAVVFGFRVDGDPYHLTWLCLGYAIASLLIAARLNATALAWLGAGILLLGIGQALGYLYGERLALRRIWLTALLVEASLLAALHLAIAKTPWRTRGAFLSALANASRLAVAAAMVYSIVAIRDPSAYLAGNFAWSAGVWLTLALGVARPLEFVFFQFAALASLWFVIASQCETRVWYQQSPAPLLHPWHLQSQGIALALAATAVSVAALATRRWRRFWTVDGSAASPRVAWVSSDQPAARFARWTAAVVSLTLAVYGVAPGVRQELSVASVASGSAATTSGAAATVVASAPREPAPIERFEWSAIPHIHALGYGGWALCGAALLAVLLRAIETRRLEHGLIAVGCTVAPPLLLAGQFEPDIAVATALHWLMAGYFAMVGIALWSRDAWRSLLGRPLGAELAFSPAAIRGARRLAVGLLATTIAAIAFVAATSATRQAPLSGVAQQTLQIGLGMLIVVAPIALWWSQITRRWPWKHSFSSPSGDDSRSPAANLLMFFAVAPMLSAIVHVVATALRDHPLTGPEPDSWFGRIGGAASWALPLVLIAATLVGHAVRERAQGYAFAAGLTAQAAAMIAYLLTLASRGVALDARQWARVAQLNAGVAAIVAIAWLAAVSRRRGGTGLLDSSGAPVTSDAQPTGGISSLLTTQAWLPMAICAVLLAGGVVGLAIDPTPGLFVKELGAVGAWISTALATAALFWRRRCAESWSTRPAPAATDMDSLSPRAADSLSLSAVGAGASAAARSGESTADRDATTPRAQTILAAIVGVQVVVVGLGWLVALAIGNWDQGNWLAYRALLVIEIATAFGLTMIPAIRSARGFVTVLPALIWIGAVGLSTRAMWGGPQIPWWTVGGCAASAIVAIRMAIWTQRARWLDASAFVLVLGASIWWIDRVSGSSAPWMIGLFEWNAVALGLFAPIAIFVERKWLTTDGLDHVLGSRPAWMARLAPSVAVVGLFVAAALGVLADLAQAPLATSAPLAWAAVASTLVAIVAAQWIPATRSTARNLWLLGLAAVGHALDSLNLTFDWLIWDLTMFLGAYAIGAAYLWSRRSELRAFFARLGAAPQATSGLPGAAERDEHLAWIVSGTCSIVALVMSLAFLIDLTFASQTLRISSGKAALLQSVAIGLLARRERGIALHRGALVTAMIGAVAFAWAWIDPNQVGQLLDRAVTTSAALFGATIVYGLGIVKFAPSQSPWLRAARGIAPVAAVAALTTVVAVLGIEATQYLRSDGVVAISAASIAVVGATLIGLSAAAIIAATSPGRDPLGLSERGRQIYVYAAEAILALFFAHLRLTMPWLFSGRMRHYWPIVVMAISFAGVAAGELFRRRQNQVLGDPLASTGALLPLLPAIGHWVAPSQVDYSLTLIVVGMLYTALAISRKSFGFGLLAALAANGSLWHFLHASDRAPFFVHPQVWLIPPAACVLAAAQLARQRLSDAQQASVRQLSLMTIYVSSTADIFLNGVAEEPWLPAVLAALSLAGAAAGIMLRIRSCLWMGTAFLLLSIAAVIHHAAVDLHQTWILWVLGIVVGALILLGAAIFEKKRDELLALVEELKQWRA